MPAGRISHLSDLYLGSLKIFIAGGAIFSIASVRFSEYCSRFTMSQVSVASALTSVFTRDSRLKINAFFWASSSASAGTPSSNGLETSKPSSVPTGTESSMRDVMLSAYGTFCKSSSPSSSIIVSTSGAKTSSALMCASRLSVEPKISSKWS